MPKRWKILYIIIYFFLIILPAYATIFKADALPSRCVVIIDGEQIIKDIGDIWNTTDPCIQHVCTIDEYGTPIEKVSQQSCSVECKNEYAEIKQPGQCCGKCVKTKCRYADKLYKVGDTWHSNDSCLIFECESRNDIVSIATFKKTCPPVPENCSEKNIYKRGCCTFCRKDTFKPRLFDSNDDDVLTSFDTDNLYKRHPCKRECVLGARPKICKYVFNVEWYETLSKACYRCPHEIRDCYRPHCIVGDGTQRSVMVVNRQMPGPAIEVCLNDTIVVDVRNLLMGESTTIHWHGLHQRQTPYMDGVPHISQCPIPPHTTFRYQFKAESAGTQFWHSHTGMQRGDGTFGALIIRKPIELDQHADLYDFDLSEHMIIIQDWTHSPSISVFTAHHHSNGSNKPPNILINGFGRYFKRSSKDEFYYGLDTRGEDLSHQKPKNKSTSSTQIIPNRFSETRKLTNLKSTNSSMQIQITNVNDTTRQEQNENSTSHKEFIPRENFNQNTEPNRNIDNSKQSNHTTPTENISDKENQSDSKSASDNIRMNAQISRLSENSKLSEMQKHIELIVDDSELFPLQKYNVIKGNSYRFRIVNAEFLNCPVSISIDNHTMIVISTDGHDVEPTTVNSLVTYAGERFDFILMASEPVDNYWIRVKGLMDCDARFTSAHQVAILHYKGASDSEPSGVPSYDHEVSGVQLNSLNEGPGRADSISIAELISIADDDDWLLNEQPDFKFYVYYDFYAKDNPHFHVPNLYGFHQMTHNNRTKLFTPQLNHISMKMPNLPLMPSRNIINESTFCNASSLEAKGINCREEFCQCTHILQIPLNSVVELVLVDEGVTYDANHPFHLHGNSFRVIGMDRVGGDTIIEEIRAMDMAGALERGLRNAPIKDTVTVPDGGYTIIRFKADNPGYWLFHCHIEFHAEIGMALILKVGENHQMRPVPKDFPTCSSYMPKIYPKEKNKASNAVSLRKKNRNSLHF